MQTFVDAFPFYIRERLKIIDLGCGTNTVRDFRGAKKILQITHFKLAR